MDKAPSKFTSILGLGFGDCGKGLFTDFLSRRWNAHTVIRFNGGSQAGHNVVLADGRHHTFSQFSAGTFNPQVRSVLAAPFVVHPTALLLENQFLHRVNIHDALGRLIIDRRCRINTPFHQAAGRLRECLRGSSRHGTCGVGFGETVRHYLASPELMLCYADLFQPRLALDKLEAIRSELQNEFESMGSEKLNFYKPDQKGFQRIEAELGILRDHTISWQWLDRIKELLHAVQPSNGPYIASILRTPGAVLFEGAQGILLDEWKGFHPYTTWSSVNVTAVKSLIEEWGLTEPVYHIGLMRSYLTRHGPGPLPTFAPELNVLAEPHNGDEGWQGDFRRGYPDEVLLRYALDAVGALDGMMVSHLDAIEKLPQGLKWCSAYNMNTSECINRLEVGPTGDLNNQHSLTQKLMKAAPYYEPGLIRDARELQERISNISKLPILFGSYGNTSSHVK